MADLVPVFVRHQVVWMLRNHLRGLIYILLFVYNEGTLVLIIKQILIDKISDIDTVDIPVRQVVQIDVVVGLVKYQI
ncbi:hypothetical protein SDC9_151594 [bioreactor metagenome]|uniref:Uncharacterized protein n=1 Tax=bioreactor metagenome TaxID=1076179 RepID=A0A645ER95_9ZZZZ